jgi:hypothetical protein
MVTYGAVKGAPKGAFILTLDSPVSHFTIELGTKRNAVQLSFVPWWSGFRSFSSMLVGIHTPPHRSGILHHHRFISVTEHSGFASNQVLLKTLADATPPLPCFYPHSKWAASGPGARWGSI